MNSSIQLADGTTVGYYTYGDPAGKPVFALHGVPTCGAGFSWADVSAREREIRLIAPDRPGIGVSSRHLHKWTVADYGRSLGAFADALAIEEFGVWGYSGGGPYALAAAAQLAPRLTHVAVSAAMGQLGVWATPDDFAKTDRQFLDLAVRHPWRARRILAAIALAARLAPGMAMKSVADEFGPADAAAIGNLGSPREFMKTFSQTFASGPAGVVDDYSALARPWEFDLNDITIDVDIFHGTADSMVPLAHSEFLAANLRSSRLTTWEGAGHLGTTTHVAEILDVFV